AQEELELFLRSQMAAQGGAPLSGERSLAVEITRGPAGGRGEELLCVILHTFRGGAVNYPLCLALAQYLEENLNTRVEAVPDDNAVLIMLPCRDEAPEILVRGALAALADSRLRQRLFRARLETSGLFGAAFREAAEFSLVLPKTGFGKRTPLWITRQRAKRLFDAVSSLADFPLIAEAWRSCLAERFDLESCDAFFEGIRDGFIAVNFFDSPVPSPFSRDIVWKTTNLFIYEHDERPDLRRNSGTSLSDAVLEEALGSARKRPPLEPAVVADFTSRLRREKPGWAPEDELALAEWVRERVAIPRDEWEILLNAVDEKLRAAWNADPSLKGRVKEILRRAAGIPSFVHRENAALWEKDPRPLLAAWLRREGPVSEERIAEVFGLDAGEARAALEALAEEGEVVCGVALRTREGETVPFVCDRENLGFLLRLSRKKSRPAIRPLPLMRLPCCLARRQNILQPEGPPWKSLACYTAPARLWETEIFPARCDAYRPQDLDAELDAGRLVWFGAGREKCGFCAPEDLDLVLPRRAGKSLFGELAEAKDFWQLKDASGLDMNSCVAAVWKEAWAGQISSTSWEPVRAAARGLAENFSVEEALPAGTRRRIPRALRERWKKGAPLAGRWFSLAADEGFYDPLDEEELDRDRVRLLVARWGVLCRPLLEREAPELSWGRLLPAIRRLELSGELVAGRFFEGIPSLQFASPSIAEELEACAAENSVFWLNACDPASPAGLRAEGLDARLPPRAAANRICLRGEELLAVSRRGGKDLRLCLPPEDAALGEILAGFAACGASVRPARKTVVETINGQSAATSPYAPALTALGFRAEWKKLILW
ncbi:MAG: hypothetical protein FWG35_05260, partial [Spirochaetaceae bacterium]|nr:hypothetical protein [Spirochaetaceae bacterium]